MTEEITNAISSATDELWGIWFLIGAALVFFMQCGFAMVETGFTRAKNAGNIIMKNLMPLVKGKADGKLVNEVLATFFK